MAQSIGGSRWCLLWHSKRLTSTCGPVLGEFSRHQVFMPPRSSCLIRDPASRLEAVHPSTPRLSWFFTAPSRPPADGPSSHSNRLSSTSRQSELIGVAVCCRCTSRSAPLGPQTSPCWRTFPARTPNPRSSPARYLTASTSTRKRRRTVPPPP